MISSRLRSLLILPAALVLAAPCLHADQHEDPRAARLSERLAAFTAAFQAGDVATLDTLLAEHYSHTNNASPPLDRAAWLETMARRGQARASGSDTTSFSNSDVKVRIAGNTAVVTGLSTMRGERNGKPFGLKIRYTHVWEWVGEDWYRVAFQDTYEPLAD